MIWELLKQFLKQTIMDEKQELSAAEMELLQNDTDI